MIIQGAISFALATFSQLSNLISFAVFNLSFSFLLVSLSLSILQRKSKKSMSGQRLLPWLGVGVSLYLLYSTGLLDKIVGSALILAGIPLYIYFSPKTDIKHLKEFFTSEDSVIARSLAKRYVFLGNLLRMAAGVYIKLKRKRENLES